LGHFKDIPRHIKSQKKYTTDKRSFYVKKEGMSL